MKGYCVYTLPNMAIPIDSDACAFCRANEARDRFSNVTAWLEPVLEVEEEEEQETEPSK